MLSKFSKKESPLAGLAGLGGGIAFFEAGALSITEFDAEFLVIAGGGQHTYSVGTQLGGGGAGGYISSVSGESSGGGASAISPVGLEAIADYSITYSVTVGAAGSNSVFSGTESDGSSFNNTAIAGGGRGATGGSGGGGDPTGSLYQGGSGTTGQGYAGSNGYAPYSACASTTYMCDEACPGTRPGAGGGAGGAANGRDGGVGVQSSITGTATYYAGGGAAQETCGGSVGSVGLGQTNYGGGGTQSGVGQPGVVILRYPNTVTMSNPGGGLTFTTSTVSSNKVTTITAGTGNIAFTPG